jgi:hypothetical protein
MTRLCEQYFEMYLVLSMIGLKHFKVITIHLNFDFE